jgi:UDP-N-acetylglucosamine--N-acetylmuramyl-(pentapeptide) pyrophosphoryl-undecaprenol N-acetylglucosamine transferase
MADAGAAIAIEDDALEPTRLSAMVAALLSDRERLGAMASAARSLARPDAADQIAAEVLAAAGAER